MKRGKKDVILILFLIFPFCAFEGEPEPDLRITGIGNGYSSPACSRDRFFITGEKDGQGYLFSFDFSGKELWRSIYGKEWTTSYRGSRAAPVVIDSLVYTVSGMGDIACFKSGNGEKKWDMNMTEDLHGVFAVFGYSMPVTIEGNRIYCLPGGPDTNIACLDRFTGDILWVSGGNGEPPGYTAPLFISHNGWNIIVVFSELAMHGLDAETGDLLWTYDLAFKGEVPCNKPVYSEGFLYIVAGPGNGAVKFEISKDGTRLKKVWDNIQFDTFFGGFVKAGNYLYGSSQSLRRWISLDTESGKVIGSLPFRIGAITHIGKELILYNQGGEVAVIQANEGKMTVSVSFKITEGTGEHFALPVLYDGRLFIRHGEALLVYNYQNLRKDLMIN